MEIVMHIPTKRSKNAETRTFTSTCDALNYMKRKGLYKIGVAIFDKGTMRTNVLNTRVWGYQYDANYDRVYAHYERKKNNAKCI